MIFLALLGAAVTIFVVIMIANNIVEWLGETPQDKHDKYL